MQALLQTMLCSPRCIRRKQTWDAASERLERTDLLAAPVACCFILHEHSRVLHSNVICSGPGISWLQSAELETSPQPPHWLSQCRVVCIVSAAYPNNTASPTSSLMQ